jgi:glycosyltransferase involved in cell wall biosynthesis
MNLTDLTIILPTRNEVNNIRTFLASIPSTIQLIVVDSSTDNTREVINECRPLNTTLLHRNISIVEARQCGAEVATTPWLLFTDADVRFSQDYFSRLAAQDDGQGALYGSKRSAGGFRNYYRAFVWGQRLLHRAGIPAATGSNLLIRRDTLLEVGGFDRPLSCSEDTEVVWRIYRRGFRVDFAPDLAVFETDHRRLRRGALAKTMHSLTRCLLLYLDLMPSRWRAGDWKYWAGLPNRGSLAAQEAQPHTEIAHSAGFTRS